MRFFIRETHYKILPKATVFSQWRPTGIKYYREIISHPFYRNLKCGDYIPRCYGVFCEKLQKLRRIITINKNSFFGVGKQLIKILQRFFMPRRYPLPGNLIWYDCAAI